MKCPKCQYFAFDSGERCRNCGYDFSLSLDVPARDLPIQDGSEPIGPLADFSLNVTPNLPFFTPESGDPDAPLVTPGATPRAPLAVRRTAPVVTRAKPRREPAPGDRDPEPRLALDTQDMPVIPEAAARRAPEPPEAPAAAATDTGRTPAPTAARVAGALIDAGLLAGIDLIVVYFTLKICDMTFAQVFELPMAPLLSFLVLLNGGYLSTFVAAGGQTLGKMAAGTRVVPADPAAPASERVSFGQATVRAAGYLVSALPVGLGFVPAFVGERRALHDRLADTRVVKA
jgi:uncharacterized RDD family membrane protein YckC